MHPQPWKKSLAISQHIFGPPRGGSSDNFGDIDSENCTPADNIEAEEKIDIANMHPPTYLEDRIGDHGHRQNPAMTRVQMIRRSRIAQALMPPPVLRATEEPPQPAPQTETPVVEHQPDEEHWNEEGAQYAHEDADDEK